MPAESPVRDGNHTDFELIETLRWEPQAGFVRLHAHLARLDHSARTLGFAPPVRPLSHLESAVGGRAPLRVRLVCAPTGRVAVSAQHFAPLPEGGFWRVRIAAGRLDSSDPLLGHKTTRRAVYETARSEYPRETCEEVLLLNERSEVCEGTITNLFLDPGSGPLLTPPVSSGLLPGILRGALLAAGTAVESVLREPDLKSARSLFVGNSLRGLIPATLC